jgi:hypothetical protein
MVDECPEITLVAHVIFPLNILIKRNTKKLKRRKLK